jgi:alpha-tubulin suppressor-like RCC1 family protein
MTDRLPSIQHRFRPTSLLPGMLLLGVVLNSSGCDNETTAPANAPQPSAAVIAAAPSFRAVSSGFFVSCGVTSDDRLFCWGRDLPNTRGKFVQSTLHFRQVTVGFEHVCAVTQDDLAYCWGANFSAQLGDGTKTSRSAPVPVIGGHRFLEVRAGGFHTCGLTLTHKALCWGDNTSGQVGDGSTALYRFRPVPVAGGISFRQLVVGWAHTCGASMLNRGFCWGSASSGQIGDGKILRVRNSPRAVAGGLSFRFLSAGHSHSCGLTLSDRAFCWGSNDDGRLGDGTTTTRLTPKAVAGTLQFSTINAGADHTCAVTTASRAYCWGNNATGQLGNGTTSDRSSPAAVTGGLLFAGVDAGGAAGESSFSCGVTTSHRAYCWGWNAFGTLGNGTTDDSPVPVAVLGP